MKTYPEWERVVLEHCYEAVDHISLHMYFANRAKNTAEYLALNAKLDAYIATIASTIDFVRTLKRSRKKVTISFDEWNVWYHSNAQDREILAGAKGWPQAPRLLEDAYNFEDALQVGCILNTFIRRSDVVRIACIAQLVNVIAPIMTEPKGAAWRQTIFYPYYFASRLWTRRSVATERQIAGLRRRGRRQCALISIFRRVHDAKRRTLTFFAVNRHGGEAIDLDVSLQRLRQAAHRRPSGDDEPRPRGRQHAEGADERDAEERAQRGGGRWCADRQAAALFLPDDPLEPVVAATATPADRDGAARLGGRLRRLVLVEIAIRAQLRTTAGRRGYRVDPREVGRLAT